MFFKKNVKLVFKLENCIRCKTIPTNDFLCDKCFIEVLEEIVKKLRKGE